MPAYSRRIRTLVVDDSPLAVRAICSCLQTEPRVQITGTASNGADALSCIERLHPEVILLDLQMPIMDGLQTASRLRDQFPEIAVFIVTGLDATGVAESLSKVGVRGIVPKQRLSEQLPRLLEQFMETGTP